MTFDPSKFEIAVHYVCDKATSQPQILGATKLYKVLWHADTEHFLKTGRSITGETYTKQQHGPLPKHVTAAIGKLKSTKKMAVRTAPFHTYQQTQFFSLLSPSLKQFSGDEVATIDAAFDYVCYEHTAKSISEESHGIIWELAQMGEEMPLHTAMAAATGEVTAKDIQRSVKAIRQYQRGLAA